MEKFKQIVKKSLKLLVAVGALLLSVTIISSLYDGWRVSIDEEIAFSCELDTHGNDWSDEPIIWLRFIIQSTPQSRERRNYWDGGLILYKDRSSVNEEKHYHYLQQLEVEKVDIDNLYLREDRYKNQLKVNRETFEVTITYDDGAIFNTKGCDEVDPQEFRDFVSDSQEKVKVFNKI